MIARLGWAAAFVALAIAQAVALDMPLPVPAVTIYPGDTIRDTMLMERDFAETAVTSAMIDSRHALVGKVARRTLLPGKAIPVGAVEEARIVANGTQVKIVFEEQGLTITSYAAALQNGRVGDLVKVRNLDSGLTVSGTVMSDGSIRVSGG